MVGFHTGRLPSLGLVAKGQIVIKAMLLASSSRRFLAHVQTVHRSSETNEDKNGYHWSSLIEPEQFIVL